MIITYEGNVQIDTPDNEWTPDAVERLFIFCQFDRAMPYEKVCASYKYLEDNGVLSFESLGKLSIGDLNDLMRRAKLRFPKLTAEYLYHNVRAVDGEILIDMSRDDIVAECWGFGYKLASMFCNRCKGTQYAIIDVHIDRYLKKNGCTARTYEDKEEFFAELARQQNKTVDELDWEIWNAERIGNREKE